MSLKSFLHENALFSSWPFGENFDLSISNNNIMSSGVICLDIFVFCSETSVI